MLYSVSLRYKESANVSRAAVLAVLSCDHQLQSSQPCLMHCHGVQCRMVRAERAARWTCYPTWTCPTWACPTDCPTAQLQLPNCPINKRPDLVLATQEANYAHQQELDMIPIMAQENYKPQGWLGLILGTRMWYAMYSAVLPLLLSSLLFLSPIDVYSLSLSLIVCVPSLCVYMQVCYVGRGEGRRCHFRAPDRWRGA
jgi:hypothetical protein